MTKSEKFEEMIKDTPKKIDPKKGLTESDLEEFDKMLNLEMKTKQSSSAGKRRKSAKSRPKGKKKVLGNGGGDVLEIDDSGVKEEGYVKIEDREPTMVRRYKTRGSAKKEKEEGV